MQLDPVSAQLPDLVENVVDGCALSAADRPIEVRIRVFFG
jgi:hypothetical protein